jgi:hypothetical protein
VAASRSLRTVVRRARASVSYRPTSKRWQRSRGVVDVDVNVN